MSHVFHVYRIISNVDDSRFIVSSKFVETKNRVIRRTSFWNTFWLALCVGFNCVHKIKFSKAVGCEKEKPGRFSTFLLSRIGSSFVCRYCGTGCEKYIRLAESSLPEKSSLERSRFVRGDMASTTSRLLISANEMRKYLY